MESTRRIRAALKIAGVAAVLMGICGAAIAALIGMGLASDPPVPILTRLWHGFLPATGVGFGIGLVFSLLLIARAPGVRPVMPTGRLGMVLGMIAGVATSLAVILGAGGIRGPIGSYLTLPLLLGGLGAATGGLLAGIARQSAPLEREQEVHRLER